MIVDLGPAGAGRKVSGRGVCYAPRSAIPHAAPSHRQKSLLQPFMYSFLFMDHILQHCSGDFCKPAQRFFPHQHKNQKVNGGGPGRRCPFFSNRIPARSGAVFRTRQTATPARRTPDQEILGPGYLSGLPNPRKVADQSVQDKRVFFSAR